MFLRFVFLGILSLFCCNGIAQEATEQERLACLFKKPFIFGASISGGYGGVTDGARAAMDFNWRNRKYLGSNPDPVTRLARKYHKNPEITNISEIINFMPNDSVGYLQWRDYVSVPQNEENLRKSTVIASIDGFYWPTIYDYLNAPAIDDECSYTESVIEYSGEIIDYGKANGIPVLLGNVPDEDASKVSPLLKGNKIIPASWWKPRYACLQKVKRFLQKECKVQDQCYVVDLYGIVENLKGTAERRDREGIYFEGRNYLYNEFRADGVHLYGSKPKGLPQLPGNVVPDGMQYLMTYIEKSVGWNLESCK